jgi:hypothetical protein
MLKFLVRRDPMTQASNFKPQTANLFLFFFVYINMKKFQVTIRFYTDAEFPSLLPSHRVYVNSLIEKGIIDHYVVTLESQRAWITFTADSKAQVDQYLSKSPIYRYWDYEIEELLVIDGQHYRLPAVQMN